MEFPPQFISAGQYLFLFPHTYHLFQLRNKKACRNELLWYDASVVSTKYDCDTLVNISIHRRVDRMLFNVRSLPGIIILIILMNNYIDCVLKQLLFLEIHNDWL